MSNITIRPSENNHKDWGYSEAGLGDFVKNFIDTVSDKIIDLRESPSDKSNIMKNWKVTVYNQGEEHSCVAAALADSVLRWSLIKHGYIKDDEMLSVRFLWMAAKEIDEFTGRPTSFIEHTGTTLKAALKIITNYGIVLDKELSNNNSSPLYNGDENSFYAKAAELKITSYFNLAKVNQNNEDVDIFKNWDKVKGIWLQWLSYNYSPILIKLDVDNSWENIIQGDKTLNKYNPFKSDAPHHHAAAIIGYNFGEKEFIIRNTAGNNWGNKGYICMHEDYAKKAIKEAYGIRILDKNTSKNAPTGFPPISCP